MSRELRPIAPPFVVVPPQGARVRARLRLDAHDEEVLRAVGTHMGSLAGADLIKRCGEGKMDAAHRRASRARRKRALTAASSSRWAGAITRTSEDSWGLASRNLTAEARSLRSRVARIQRRLAEPVGACEGRVGGYHDRTERFFKQQRLQALRARLSAVEARLDHGAVSVCRGGRRLANSHHHVMDFALTEDQWRARWEAARLFITADGESAKPWGNETIRWHPDDGWLELKLPAPLSHLANRPHGRYRLSCVVAFSYRGDEVSAQAASGAVRYDISFDAARHRWYLDASWRMPDTEPATFETLRAAPMLGVDLNLDYLAAVLTDPSGNPRGAPTSIGLDLAGLPAQTRDGRLRAAISELLPLARAHGCAAVAIENLHFAELRDEGKEYLGKRPSRGARDRAFRPGISGFPAGQFRDRLTQMAANAGLWVVAVDPAHTTKWGAEHWLGAMQEISAGASGHHAAALVIARRGLGHRARRRERCDSTPAEHGRERATDSAVWAAPADAGLSEQRTRDSVAHEARGQPYQRRKTQRADLCAAEDQVPQDRSGAPTEQDSVLLSALGTV